MKYTHPRAFVIIGVLIAISCVVLFMASCSREVTRKQFEVGLHEKISAGMNTIQGVAFYCGSDERWNYYYLDLPFETDEKYKIRIDDDIIKDVFPLTTERSKWIAVYPPYVTKINIGK